MTATKKDLSVVFWARKHAEEEKARAILSAQLRAQGIPPELCRNGHDRTVVGVSAKRECKQCNRDRERARRTGSGPRVAPGWTTDGFEDEYGPVPARVPDHEWYDPVIVSRALLGYPTGRHPYPLEQEEIVRRMTPDMDQTEVARWCGVSTSAMSRWVEKYG